MGTDPVTNKVALNSSLNFSYFCFLMSKMELASVIASIRYILILLVEPIMSSFFFYHFVARWPWAGHVLPTFLIF